MKPLFTTVKRLVEEMRTAPAKARRSIEDCHLHFNGPGAAGFGVKRTAMLLPEAAMLLVAPGCCGRHGTITGARVGFEDRMFYLRIDERDLVTGNYQRRIPEAARLVCEKAKPKVLLLCMTCVDALLGSDLVGIGRRIEAAVGIPVVSCFMDPITRESKRAPMVSVQQAIMQCLEKSPTEKDAANVIGGFVPLDEDTELYPLLRSAGIRTVRQISACKTYEEYQQMGAASLNIVIHPQAVASAQDLERKLGIPYVELEQFVGPDRVVRQYERLSEVLGKELPVAPYAEAARKELAAFAERHPGLLIAVGEAVNGNPLEIALTFLEAGLEVPFVFRTILQPQDLPILEALAERRPDLPVFSGVHPSMLGRDFSEWQADAALGLDAGYFLPGAVSVCWNMERQAFGFEALTAMLKQLEKDLAQPVPHHEQLHGSYLVV